MARITLATYPKHAGRTRLVTVGNVTHYVDYVPYADGGDITYQKYTQGYRALSARPYVTRHSAYGSLEAAVKALIKSAASVTAAAR